jgi:hypothetical protein
MGSSGLYPGGLLYSWIPLFSFHPGFRLCWFLIAALFQPEEFPTGWRKAGRHLLGLLTLACSWPILF